MGHQGEGLGTPVYNLLGGRARDGVTVYGHASGATIERRGGGGRRATQRRATRPFACSAGFPGMAQPYGVGRGDLFYEPAEIDLPIRDVLEAGPYLPGCRSCSPRMRDAVG